MKTPLGKLLLMIENNDLDVNAALITKPESVVYYSGYTGGNAILFIHLLVRYIIIMDGTPVEPDEGQYPDFKVVRLKDAEIKAFLCQLCSKLGIHRIWFEEEHLENYTMLEKSLKSVQFIPAGGMISQTPLKTPGMVE
ncbi:MAG: hypothetical protein GX094_00935 [Clostridiales bacterium]|nr:hypothetical protein [Clostridiales bacterium]